MKHYNHLTEEQKDKLFYIKPKEFTKYSPKEYLSLALGGTLYMPCTRPTIADEIIEKKHPSLTSMVMCLEDAIGDEQIQEAETNLLKNMQILNKALEDGSITENDLPLMFVRVRNADQLKRLLTNVEDLKILCGFVLPKFSSKTGINYLRLIQMSNEIYDTNFYAMPILESSDVIYKETRLTELLTIKGILDSFKEIVLNVRLGATDFSSLFGIRRGMDFTIYDIAVIKDCITDIINVFNRKDEGYVISGPVWEYFSNHTRILKPMLRETPFIKSRGKQGLVDRKDLINDYKAIDGLIREVILDKANGLVGKTMIHPSHISFVNSLQIVTQEEYEDAKSILESQGIGVVKSGAGNKMNEIKPHTSWAMRIMAKSKIYGVMKKDENYTSLF